MQFLIASQGTFFCLEGRLPARTPSPDTLRSSPSFACGVAKDVWKTAWASAFLLRGTVPSCQVAVRSCTLQMTTYSISSPVASHGRVQGRPLGFPRPEAQHPGSTCQEFQPSHAIRKFPHVFLTLKCCFSVSTSTRSATNPKGRTDEVHTKTVTSGPTHERTKCT